MRVGRDQYLKVLEARETMVSIVSGNIGKAGKIDDGNIGSPNSRMLVVHVKIVNLIVRKWEVKQMSGFLGGRGEGSEICQFFFPIHL